MNRKLTFLALGFVLVAALTFALVDTTPPIHAGGNPFFDCLDDCDAAVNACYAGCGPNDYRCEFDCNNAWWSCNDACSANNPGFP